MKMIFNLRQMLSVMPLWVQLFLGAFLLIISMVSLYGRINLAFGARVFSRIPVAKIRKNIPHIIQYTIIPLIVTAYYFCMLIVIYTENG